MMIRSFSVKGFLSVNTSFPSNFPLPATPSAEELDRYLTGASASDEHGRVSAWLAQFSGVEEGLQLLRTQNDSQVSTIDVDHQFKTLTDQIYRSSISANSTAATVLSGKQGYSRESRSGQQAPVRTSRIWFRSLILSLSAAALLVAGWFAGDINVKSSFSEQPFIYTTANGERGRITLPDGSHVNLSVASSIEIPADFAAGNRNVSLQGEAVFTVTHNTGSPFVVSTASTSTRVLGTRFAVRQYDSDANAVIAVQEGRVAVGNVVVAANQEVVVNNGKPQVVQSLASHRFQFEQGTLVLDGVSLEDAIPDLNRWFNAKIQLGDPSLATRILSGDCTAGSVANLAELLELTFDIKVVRRGNILTLYSKDS